MNDFVLIVPRHRGWRKKWANRGFFVSEILAPNFRCDVKCCWISQFDATFNNMYKIHFFFVIISFIFIIWKTVSIGVTRKPNVENLMTESRLQKNLHWPIFFWHPRASIGSSSFFFLTFTCSYWFLVNFFFPAVDSFCHEGLFLKYLTGYRMTLTGIKAYRVLRFSTERIL